MKEITNLEALARAQAVCKGYEDGLLLCKSHPLSDLLYFIGFMPEKSSQAHIATEHLEHYRIGFMAAWDEKRGNVSIPHGSYHQAMMRDLEES